MWRKKLKPVTPAKRSRATLKLCCGLILCLPALSCRQEMRPSESDALRIRLAHLQDYAWQDRRQSGQPVEMKPEAEREALLRELHTDPAQILLCRGLGSEAALAHLQAALRDQDLNYPHRFYVPGSTVYAGLAFLSQTPFIGELDLGDQRYRIKDREYQPWSGAVLIQTPSFPRMWLWNSQAPEPDQAYERRRNDARILATAIRDQINAGDAVLLSLHSREAMDSPMFRMLEEAGLQRLIPEDRNGDSWTFRDPEGVLYRQDQWLFASLNLAKVISDAPVVYDSPDLRRAGPYRHQGLSLP